MSITATELHYDKLTLKLFIYFQKRAVEIYEVIFLYYFFSSLAVILYEP